jgi:cadmium resistance protein CadD (predicted permease)
MGRKSGLEQFVGGLGTGGLCLALYYLKIVPHAWILGMAVFAGALPVVSGLKRMAAEFANRPRLENERKPALGAKPESAQKAILRIAKDHRGVVTPALVSVESCVELEAASKELDAMASKGYAEMRVRDSGVIEYVFSEFAID